MTVDVAADPVLALSRDTIAFDAFRAQIVTAVDRDARLAEAKASIEEARAARTLARSARYPRATASLTTNQIISRSFSNNLETIVEQSLAQRRTDATFGVEQPLFDFGATGARVAAAGARLRAASLAADDSATTIALEAIASWYDVFSYRALVALSQSAIARQIALRGDIDLRITNGYLADGDRARADGYIATMQSRAATYRRALANAEAHFINLVGTPPPVDVGRPPLPAVFVSTEGDVLAGAEQSDAVRQAEAMADAARRDAAAAKRDRLPTLGASIDAGRFGFAEHLDDYSVTGRVTLRARFSPGFNATTRQYDARATSAEARAQRVRQDATRDASIAWSDVNGLADSLVSLRDSYIAARRGRDVLDTRFRVSRGTLFDLEVAEQNYYETATNYVQTLTDLDAARYVLLAKSGKLLATFAIAPIAPVAVADRR